VGRIKRGARAERGQQEFRRRHSLVEPAILDGLIAYHGVLPGEDRKLQII
jgi:hypothetical protein